LEAEQSAIITDVIAQMQKQGCFIEGGYYALQQPDFITDLRHAVRCGWEKQKFQNKYSNLYHFALAVALAYDRYALRIYSLFPSAVQGKPISCPLLNKAHYLYSCYDYKLHDNSIDDLLSITCAEILHPGLSILSFRSESDIDTWIYSVLVNQVKLLVKKEEREQKKSNKAATLLYLGSDIPTIEEQFEEREVVLNFLSLLSMQVEKERGRLAANESSPLLEKAWLLWNDYFYDLYMEQNLPGNQRLSPFFFPAPPADLHGQPGRHNPAYTEYLARYIGRQRGLSSEDIDRDLGRPMTPKDQSRLRALVRIRRNGAKRMLYNLYNEVCKPNKC
jgi:hypothetical protein